MRKPKLIETWHIEIDVDVDEWGQLKNKKLNDALHEYVHSFRLARTSRSNQCECNEKCDCHCCNVERIIK
jgi:hypothetical protein